MLKRNQSVLLFSAIALLAFFGGPASASDNGSLAGSWEVLSMADGSTDEIPSLFTYGAGGTLIATGPTSANSASHGAWTQTGSRTYSSNEVSFLYGPTGEIIGTISASATVTLASDGQTYDAEFAGTLQFTGGPAIPISGTAAGSRISAGGGDGDSDSDSDSDSD